MLDGGGPINKVDALDRCVRVVGLEKNKRVGGIDIYVEGPKRGGFWFWCGESSPSLGLLAFRSDVPHALVRPLDVPLRGVPGQVVPLAVEDAHPDAHLGHLVALPDHAQQGPRDVRIVVNAVSVVLLERQNPKVLNGRHDPGLGILGTRSQFSDERWDGRGVFERDGVQVGNLAEHVEEVVLAHFRRVQAQDSHGGQRQDLSVDLVGRVFDVREEQTVQTRHFDVGKQADDVLFGDPVEFQALEAWSHDV